MDLELEQISDLERIRGLKKDSFFNMQHYETTVPMDSIKESLVDFGFPLNQDNPYNRRNKIDSETFYNIMIPEFQRDNNKWTKEMKIKFVENLILGVKTEVLLGNIYNRSETGTYCNCKLIDGQQRLNAITDFLDGKFPIFENIYYSSELDDLLRSTHNIKAKVYTFKDEEEMVRFYIQMNENITHSSEDISKAKKYLNNL